MENFWLSIMAVLNKFLMFFGLRSRPRHWGIVYDSVTKQPVDPAIVKLIEARSGKVVGTCVTDLYGHYGFITRTGKFKLLVQRTNYHFPSQEETGESDGLYKNLYHGEFFEVSGEADVIALNIPIDPLRPDWNQSAKFRLMGLNVYWERLLVGIAASLFWAGLILSALLLFFTFSRLFLEILIVYGIILLLAWMLPRVRLWGRVEGLPAGADVFVELVHSKLPDIVIGRSQVTEEGKYFLRAPAGRYKLLAIVHGPRGQEVLGHMFLRVGEDGVINKTLKLK
jgi:hypothetical protein